MVKRDRPVQLAAPGLPSMPGPAKRIQFRLTAEERRQAHFIGDFCPSCRLSYRCLTATSCAECDARGKASCPGMPDCCNTDTCYAVRLEAMVVVLRRLVAAKDALLDAHHNLDDVAARNSQADIEASEALLIMMEQALARAVEGAMG